MGTWGTGIYQNDTASDVKDDWLDGLSDNEPVKVLTRRLLNEYDESFDGDNPDPEFWTGLAAIQFRTGHLDKAVKDKTLSLIASGKAMGLWDEEEPKIADKRRIVLEELANKLNRPQPKPRKTKKRGKQIGKLLDKGDVILLYGKKKGRALAVVVDHTTYPRTDHVDSIIQILYWDGKKLPKTAQEVESMESMREKEYVHLNITEALINKIRWPGISMSTIITTSLKDSFNDNIGRVIFKGINYPAAGSWDDTGKQRSGFKICATSWENVRYYIDSELYSRDRKVTRRYISNPINRIRKIFKIK